MNSLSGPLSNIPGKLEFGNVGFEGWGKPESRGEKPFSARRELTAQPTYGTDARI